jgi:drug/metabolite transporter (DMT)-like permease
VRPVESRAAPFHAWGILAIAVLAVSSAGTVFLMMPEVGPLLKAAWRLQATALILLPFFLYQMRTTDFQWDGRVIAITFASGVFLWIHFGSWVWSLDHTSLTHSLLFVTAHPLIIVGGMTLLRMHPHRYEAMGAGIAIIGAIIAVQDAGSGRVTLVGDAAAFLGAVAIVGYLAAGRVLRKERRMPLFLYAFPVTLVGAVLLTGHAMVAEGATMSNSVAGLEVFGWTDAAFFALVAYLALGPGLAGHTGINASLRYLPPLVISVSVVLEPLLGGMLGWALGVEEIPSLWTWVGGPFMVTGTALVILGSHRRLTQDPLASESE